MFSSSSYMRVFVFFLFVAYNLCSFSQDSLSCVETGMENYSLGWEYITYSNKEKFYYLLSSIKQDKNDKNIKDFYILSSPFIDKIEEVANKLSYPLKDFCYIKMHYKINCNENKIGVINNYFYNSKGDCIYTQNSIVVNLEDVVPETIGETIFNVICKVQK